MVWELPGNMQEKGEYDKKIKLLIVCQKKSISTLLFSTIGIGKLDVIIMFYKVITFYHKMCSDGYRNTRSSSFIRFNQTLSVMSSKSLEIWL